MRPNRVLAALAGCWTVAGSLLLALALRLASWPAVFRGRLVLFVDTDDYYHFRRMMTAAADFPRLESLDHYLGYGSWFHTNWPPLYDWLGGLIMRLAAGGSMPSLESAQGVAAFIPVAAGLITLGLFYRVATKLVDGAAARLALLAAAVAPMLVQYTMLGRPDHHCFENLWFLLALPSCLELLKEGPVRKKAVSALCAASSLALGTLFWIGTVLFSVMLFLFFVVEILVPARPPARPPRDFRPLALVFLLQVPWLIVLCAGNHWYRLGAWAFDAPSPFQPLLLGCLGLWVLALHHRLHDGLGRRTAGVFAAALALSALTLWKSLESFALFYSVLPRPMRAFGELVPFFRPEGVWSFAQANADFGLWALGLAPLAVFWAWEKRNAETRLVLVWLAVTGALMAVQTRYAYQFSFPACLVWGFGVSRAIGLWDVRMPGRRVAGRIAVGACAALLAYLPLRNTVALFLTPPDLLTPDPALIEACRWIRTHTPPTRSLWKDEGLPEYGVYALHGFGDEIAAIAQRPALAGNMHLLGREIAGSVAFFFLTDEGQAYRFLSRKRQRYVLISDMISNGLLPDYMRQYGQRRFEARRAAGRLLVLPAAYWELLYMRLFFCDGSTSERDHRPIVPASHFRLAYESPPSASGVGVFKLFQVVPGARLEGRCRSGQAVQAEVEATTNQGRRFTYRNGAQCTPSGDFTLTVPYPGRYLLRSGKARVIQEVSDEAVESGAQVKAGIRAG